MEFNFSDAIDAAGGPDELVRLANEARPPASYLLNQILPEENRNTYHVSSRNMTVRATMAGLVGMDSPYPPSGAVSVSSFLENTAKLGNHVKLSEEAIRLLQDTMVRLRGFGEGDRAVEAMADEALNFYETVVIQPQLDASEWLRGQALCFGVLDWQYNKKGWTIDYDVPAANILATRTGTNHYGGTTSKFWDDVFTIRTNLRRFGTRVILAHPDTVDLARRNTANAMVATAESDSQITFRRIIPGTREFTPDSGDQVTIVLVPGDGEVLNANDPESTVIVPFFERGKLVGIGNAGRPGYRPGQGSQENAAPDGLRLGYTHIGPTVEGRGRPGRWGRLLVPEGEPWSLHGQSASNQVVCIEDPDRLVIATSDMS